MASDTNTPTARAAGLPPAYKPADHETRIRARWDASGAFHADPARVRSAENPAGKPPYCVLIPPPNVTGVLHLGHALNNTLQDILVRTHRMRGFETLWMPGTDHAGIATQTVVEKRILADGGKPRVRWDRDEFIARVQDWKDEYEERITNQLKLMGSSCDWDRQRFTMDEVCAHAVREAFFRLFKAGLIYRGKRLVNWDPVTQTALADDEVEMREVQGAFYYLRYPLCDEAGAPRTATLPTGETVDHITVATTRPETYLGDTAVALNPHDPRAPALRGLHVRLPLVGRIIPIIEDDYVVLPDADSDNPKARHATGFLKVTPAHDENDYLLGQRHDLQVINIFAPDASISDQHGWSDVGDAAIFVGLSREDARTKVVAEFESRGLLEEIRTPYVHSVGHSYRSHAMIEPYLSDQWYVKVTDDRLAGAAQRALASAQQSGHSKWLKNTANNGTGVPPVMGATGSAPWSDMDGALTFHPARYAKTYEDWHENLRDWCVSRQLWWGHRIPVWTRDQPEDCGPGDRETIEHRAGRDPRICVNHSETQIHIALLEDDAAIIAELEASGFRHDPDVLDTWFSSALWPLSTMGWPDPAQDPRFDGLLDAFKPTSALCTARDIITLWVSRMVMFNRFFADGQIPFHDVYIHPVIQDGDGKRMSKSAGNGVDPLEIIHTHGADAMRFTLCQLASQTQDVRLPVERDEATGRNTSPKFDLGKRFCNKLWNASRFTLMMLAEAADAHDDGRDARPTDCRPTVADLPLIDRWMLSRLAHAAQRVEAALASYEFNTYADTMYDLLWTEFCDWYLEAVKPTVRKDPAQRAVLRAALDGILRLLHPVAPFVTEAIHEELRSSPTLPAPAGVTLGDAELLCLAPWPSVDASLRDEALEARFDTMRELVRMIRDARSAAGAPPRKPATLHTTDALAAEIAAFGGVIETMACLSAVTTDAPEGVCASFTLGAEEHRLSGLVEQADAAAERARLEKTLADIDGAIATFEKRLANPGYTEKAPPNMVQETRDQLAAKRAERGAIVKSLANLS